MGFGDKFKDLAKQAQDAVAERKEQITEAVDRASVAADARTGGKYSEQIAKVGKKAEQVVEKLSGEREAGGEAAGAGAETAAGAGGTAAGTGAQTAAGADTAPGAGAETTVDGAGEDPPAKPRPDATGFPDFG